MRYRSGVATSAVTVVIAVATALATHSAMALDLNALWDFRQPELSEQRFRAALPTASGDDVLILQTQIARSHGLRRDFATARQLLKTIEPGLVAAGAEARTRHALELGRTHASGTHRPDELDDQAKAQARACYERAIAIAKGAQLDGLQIDAIHMLAFIDTAPADQLKWGQQALAVTLASSQPAARQWEASIRNNIGHALHQLGRYDEALAQFQQALAIRERGSNAWATHVAHWMVAWTLRALGRGDEALAIQLRLEREREAAQSPDPHVFEELALLYRARGDADRAAYYAGLAKAKESK